MAGQRDGGMDGRGEFADARAALAWLVSIGADEAVDDQPRDRLTGVRAPTAPLAARGAGEQRAAPSPPPPRAAPTLATPAPATPTPAAPPRAGSPPAVPPAAGLRAAAPTTAAMGAAPLGAAEALPVAVALAGAAGDLEQLMQAWLAFEAHPLRETAAQVARPQGPSSARLMVLGGAAGNEEDIAGQAFVGPPGRLLTAMLAAIGQRIEAVHRGLALPLRPPGGRRPTAGEIALARPLARRHLALVGPAIVLLCGEVAAQAVLDTADPLRRLRGRWHEGPELPSGCRALVLPDIAALIAAPLMKRQAWQDLLFLQSSLAQDVTC